MRSTHLAATAFAVLAFAETTSLANEPTARPRIIATTDGEIDDRCSMVRFLLYNNEWDIEGIIHSSSKFHWKGDGKKIKPRKWADEVWLDKQIDLYEKVYPTLSKHDTGFYTPAQLRKLIYTGNVENVGEMKKDTPGSDRIVEILLDDKPGPVYLQAWGGTNTIARALWKIQHEHPDQMDKVSKKAILYIILDQDKTFRGYIEPNWPKIRTLDSIRQFASIAYGWHKIIPQPEKAFFEKPWMEKNILKDHGPLCAIYEGNRGAFRSEGDSPAFMHQIDVGLRSLEDPSYGGWGGRFQPERKKPDTWRGAKDDGNLDKPIYRWAPAFQNDWAARADWCVKSPKEANHPPVVKLKHAQDLKAKPGETVELAAEATDPDGNKVSYKWWQYREPGTYPHAVKLTDANKAAASFVAPKDSKPGQRVHIICEATDDGAPPLTRYRRVIVEFAK